MYFALSVVGAFVVRTETIEALAIEIDRIIERYPNFTAQHLKKGVWIIEAKSIKGAKEKFQNREKSNVFITPELPLFTLHPDNYQLSIVPRNGRCADRELPASSMGSGSS